MTEITPSGKEQWEIQRNLGEGGQGHTFIVKNKFTSEVGVLKTLKDPHNLKARKRMFQEVSNLILW